MAVYPQDEWNVTPRWSVYLGARWEGFETRSAGNSFEIAKSRTSVWSPLLQTLWKLPGTKSDQVRFAVTRTYKAPSLQNLIPRLQKSDNNSATEPDYRGNPDLQRSWRSASTRPTNTTGARGRWCRSAPRCGVSTATPATCGCPTTDAG
jgi:outer membrane receptor protein involved in Fe transport